MILTVIAFIFVAAALFIIWRDRQFGRHVLAEFQALAAEAEAQVEAEEAKAGGPSPFSYLAIEDLPVPLQRYFRFAVPEGRPLITFAHMRHGGHLRQGPEKKWNPIRGEQVYLSHRPAFVWFARLRMAPLIWVKARDSYGHGQGRMTIKILSAFTVADSRGPELDVGSLLRYLSELPWLPTALLPSEFLSWEPVDDDTARAILHEGELRATADFEFGADGRITHMTTNDRYYPEDGEQVKMKWSVVCREYREMGGMRIPTELEAIWHLPEGDYSYARFAVEEIVYNEPQELSGNEP